MLTEETTDDTQRLAILDGLAQAIAARRQEAITHRASSGIEQEWTEDEECYCGIDDGNRHEFVNSTVKPLAGGGTGAKVPKRYGSTVVPNICSPYVDAAAARIGDMLLPTDDRNFALEPTPIPDLVEAVIQLHAAVGDPGQEMPGHVMMPGGPIPLDQLQQRMAQIKAEATRKAGKAQDRIDDWLVECDYSGELRQVIDDCAKLGSGVIKGPTPRLSRTKVWIGGALEIKESYVPGSKRISCWDLFPDKDCGQRIHEGDYIFERDRLSATKLGEFRGQDGYIDSQINLVLEQGPARYTVAGRMDADKAGESKDLYEVWYYYGIVKQEEINAAGCECEQETVSAIITMVNDVIIRASLNLFDNGDFPYDIIPWKRRPGMPWGKGVARDIRTPQRMVTAATRRLLDNAGFASGPQIIIRKNGIRPKDGKWEITPLKMWEADDDTIDVSKAFISVTFPMLINELERIIQIGTKFAEDVTGLPMLLQGQQGKAPDTVGGMTMLNNNANAVLRRIARLFDSEITEPHIQRYYDYLMEYGEDQDEKGDYQINARGSSALVERDIQTQEMVQVLQLSANPAYGWNPKKAASEYLKSRRFDPAQFEYTEEEQQQIAQQPQPKPPVIEAAEIRAASAEKIAGVRAHVDMANDKSDTDRDLIYVRSEMARAESDHQARMAELSVKRELALLDYSNKHQMTLDQVKADLAKTALTLQTQKELAHVNTQAKQVARPAFEPRGKAPNGQAFQR